MRVGASEAYRWSGKRTRKKKKGKRKKKENRDTIFCRFIVPARLDSL